MSAVLVLLLVTLAGPPVADGKAGDTDAVDLVWMTSVPAEPPPTVVLPDSAHLREKGARLYSARCAACHGEHGDGQGPASARLDPAPTDFTRGVFKLRSTPSGTLPTERDLFATLTRGMHGTRMIPWSRLSVEDRWALVYWVRSFSPRFASERSALPVAVPTPPEETGALRAAGRHLYGLLRCASCHGESGQGNGPAVAAYRYDGAVRAVRMRNFTRGQFIRGTGLADIYLTLRTGLDGTPMGAYDALGPDDTWALATYVRTLIRQWPLPDVPR